MSTAGDFFEQCLVHTPGSNAIISWDLVQRMGGAWLEKNRTGWTVDSLVFGLKTFLRHKKISYGVEGIHDVLPRYVRLSPISGLMLPTNGPASSAFEEVLADMLTVHRKKSQDYAPDHDPFGNFREAERMGFTALDGVMIRLSDKTSRLFNLYRQGGEALNEPIEDNLLDLANYAVIALSMWKKGLRGSRHGGGE